MNVKTVEASVMIQRLNFENFRLLVAICTARNKAAIYQPINVMKKHLRTTNMEVKLVLRSYMDHGDPTDSLVSYSLIVCKEYTRRYRYNLLFYKI